MNCYMLNYSTPVLSIMDRRRSFPQGKEAERNDIELVVSAYYNAVSPDSPTGDLVSGGIQSFNLNPNYSHHPQFNQYRSTSSLSSNSGQSSRRQSFSSTTSNSAWNDGSGTSSAINCCGGSCHSAGTTGPGHLASGSLSHHCASLLRARLLNMSQTDEEPEDISRPLSQNKHHEHDAKSFGASGHSCEGSSQRQRSSSMSTGRVVREDYPCVGPFEKKKRSAREKRLSETEAATDKGSGEQSGVKPMELDGAEHPVELPLFEDSTKQQVGPINLCKHDEEIAANLQRECYMQEGTPDTHRFPIHWEKCNAETRKRSLSPGVVEAMNSRRQNPSPESVTPPPESSTAGCPLYVQAQSQHSEALNIAKLSSYFHPELGTPYRNAEDKSPRRSASRESGREPTPEYELHLSPQGSQHSGNGCGGTGSRPRSTGSFHQFLNSPLPHPEIEEEEEYSPPISRIVFELGEPNSAALAHLQMLARVETDERVSGGPGVDNFSFLPEVQFRKRAFTQPDDLHTRRINAAELVPGATGQRRPSFQGGIRTAAERKMIAADEMIQAPRAQSLATLISLPLSESEPRPSSRKFEFVRPCPPELASLAVPILPDSRRMKNDLEAVALQNGLGLDAAEIHKNRPGAQDFDDAERSCFKYEQMSCPMLETFQPQGEGYNCKDKTEPMEQMEASIPVLESRFKSANPVKTQPAESELVSEDQAFKKTAKEGKKAPKKVLQCPDCPKSFSQLRNFRYHRSRHEGTDLFQCTCPVCGKKFNDKGYLSSHLKIHNNKKEYQCEYCEKSFNQRVAYNMHVRIHTGVKPHQCTYCEKAFSRKMLLRQHLRTHTGERPYSCAICSKAFADRSNMLLHQKLHSGNRPYACMQCDKTFSKNHHLKTHLNHHLGIKPYSCSNCGHTFSQSSNMKTHMKKCCAKDVDKAKLNIKPPSVRAVRTPIPGKAAAPAPPKKRLSKRMEVRALETKNEVDELQTPQRTPDTYEALKPMPIPEVDNYRQRATSIDSSVKRPSVIHSLNYSGGHHNSVLAKSSEWKRPEEQYAKSLQDLHQAHAMHHRMSFPMEAYPPPRHMLMARRFSDLSNTTATGRMGGNTGHTASLAHSMDRFLHAQMMAQGHSLSHTFPKHVSPHQQSPPTYNQVSVHQQNFQDFVKAHPNIQEDQYATCVQKLKMLELYRRAPTASPDENQRGRSQSFGRSSLQFETARLHQQTIHETHLKRPRSRSPEPAFPIAIGEEKVGDEPNYFPSGETEDVKPRVRSYSDCHKHRRQQNPTFQRCE